MIQFAQLKKLNPFPIELNIPNKELILNLIYEDYSNFKSINDVDKKFNEKQKEQTYYIETIRPIIKILFDLGDNIFRFKVSKRKIARESITGLTQTDIEFLDNSDTLDTLDTLDNNLKQKKIINPNLKILIDMTEDYDPIERLILNNSQTQVYEYYKLNGIESGIICHATGTGKTNCIFLTIGYNVPDTVFILCSYKNILKQMFYNSNEQFNYKEFRKLKYSSYLDIWEYEIYNLSIETDNIRKSIMSNIEQIKTIKSKKIFIINPQYISTKTQPTRYKQLPVPNLIIHDECHFITGGISFEFLNYFKSQGSVIIGLSATPVRNFKSESNYQLLRDIYSNNLLNDKINIISSYENIKAIINDDILNIEIHWFEADLTEKISVNRSNEANINNCLNCIANVCSKLANRKILIWCKTIDHCCLIYKKILNSSRLQTIFTNGIYIDHSNINKLPQKNPFSIFKPIESNAILICADKYREGSDIEYLDCVVFVDLVKVKSELPFIQCIGRVQRRGYNKQIGTVIDHYNTSSNYEEVAKDVVKKLMTYYYEFFIGAKSILYDDNKINNAIKMYEDILDKYTFTNNNYNNLILIKLTDKISIKIYTGLSDINFTNIKDTFVPIIKQHIQNELKLNEDEILKFEYENFKKLNQTNILYQIESKLEYISRINEFNLEPEPEMKYATIWINWYDYLGINTDIYPETIYEWKKLCKQYNIRSYNDYLKKIKTFDNMPLMPEELYKIKSLILEFNNLSSINYNQ
jgi:superfamily II DNA or RNA helicase